MKFGINKEFGGWLCGCVIVFLLLTGGMVSGQERGWGDDGARGGGAKNGGLRVGLTLGGGGAKGAAHIGVLKYLEEQGIEVDYVSGTSIGSIVGGLYALGYSADELAELIGGLDWSMYITNGLERRYRSASSKQERSAYLLSVPFNLGSLERNITAARQRGSGFLASLPSSFMGGNNITNLLNNLSLGYQDSMSFDEYPIPFACVATDVVTGKGVVMRSGRFATAVRASMAIPGVFSPVEQDGMVLVDGGLVNNFPVDVCREMGADVVIGVEVSDKMATDASELRSLPQLVNQFISVAVQGNVVDNRKSCDLYMHPNIEGYGTMSFNKAAIDTLVRRGYECAKAHGEEIAALKRRIEASGRVMGEKRGVRRAARVGGDRLVLMNITMPGVSEADKNWLLSKTKLATGVPISGNDITDAMNLIKGTGAYSSVNYQMLDVDSNSEKMGEMLSSYNLEIDVTPSPRHAFALGARYDSEEAASVLLNIGFNRNTISGLKADISFRLAQNFHLDMVGTYAARRFGKLNLAYRLYNSRFDLGSLLQSKYTSTHFYRHDFSFYLSEFYLYRVSGMVGVEEEFLLFDRFQEGNSLLYGTDNLKSGSLGLFGTLKYDSRDDSYFAREGANVDVDAHWRIDNNELGEKERSGMLGFVDMGVGYQHYITPLGGRITIIPQLYTRFIIGSGYHFAYRNMVGGELSGRYIAHQMPFVGVLVPQQTERCATVARVDLRWNVKGKHYVTATANYLASSELYWKYFTEEYKDRYGFGLQYAYDSPVGPLSLTLFWSNVYERFGAYVSLGYRF